MDWIFLILGVGSLIVLIAQLLEYIVDAAQARRAKPHLSAYVTDGPPRHARPSTEVIERYKQAA